ncbi:MAG: amidohydrolase family protein [Alphaproteobacteria bacterium]|nr:amidohydrolase family protein [Alphaproteobacteria bacterium]
MSRRPTLIAGARIVDPASGRDARGDILFADDILDVADAIEAPNAARIDGAGLCVMPGLIDMRVGIGEPGAEHRETFKSAGRAAAAGGVTTLVMTPGADPVIDVPSLVDFVLRRAPARAPVRILPAAALTRGLKGELMTEFGLLQEAGAVMFSNGDRSVVDSRVLRRALAYSTVFGALTAHRPEDPFLAAGGVMHEGELAARLGLPGVPAAAETIMAVRDLALAALTGARLMLDMLSSAATLEHLARAKKSGVNAVASVSVHHLTLNEQDVDGYRTFAKLSPPLRSEADRTALCDAVSGGVIDVIVSGHDPWPAENKRLPFDEAAFGATALETLLPAALQLHHNGAARLIDVVRAMTLRPAELLGLKQGRLVKGAPADLILVDLDAPYRLDSDLLLSKSKNSPFDEKLMQGRVMRTFVGGAGIFANEPCTDQSR